MKHGQHFGFLCLSLVLALCASIANGQLMGLQQQQALQQQAMQQQAMQAQAQAQAQQAQGPLINWGQCPQLEPTMAEKMKKAGVITKCLQVTPIPNNVTRESVAKHREQVAACALNVEGWLTLDGKEYKYEKAEAEIKAKTLVKDVEEKVLGYHKQCKTEAEQKYPASGSNSGLISQIQLYQACMDYFISEVCGIQVMAMSMGQDGQGFAQYQ